MLALCPLTSLMPRSFRFLQFVILLSLICLVRGDYGDPWPNTGSFADQVHLPMNVDRPLMVALNFLRSDPKWWAENVFQRERHLLYYASMPSMKYDRRLAGPAFWHAWQMANFSSSSCLDLHENTSASCLNITTCPDTCCFRPEDCEDINNTPADYLLEFGFRWNSTVHGGYGLGFVGGPDLAPSNMLQITKQIFCHAPDPSRPDECAPSDENSVQKDMFRSALFTPDFLLFGAGYAYRSDSKLKHYWQFNTGYINGDPSYIPDDNGIASATFIQFNSTMKGFLMNWYFVSHETGIGVPDGTYPTDPSVVIVGVGKIPLMQIGNSMNYWVPYELTLPCTEFAFGALDAHGVMWRFPEDGNIRMGPNCSSEFIFDETVNQCAGCDSGAGGTCIQNTCYPVDTSRNGSNTRIVLICIVVVGVVLLLSIAIAITIYFIHRGQHGTTLPTMEMETSDTLLQE